MIESLVLGNAVFAVVLFAVPFRKGVHAKAAVFAWSMLTVAYIYYLVSLAGASNPFVNFFGLRVPLCVVPGIVLVTLVLAVDQIRWAASRHGIMLLIVVLITAIRRTTQVDAIVYAQGVQTPGVVALLSLTVAIEVCLLAPVTMYAGNGRSIASKLLPVSRAELKRYSVMLLSGLVMIAGVFFISQTVLYGNPFHFALGLSISSVLLKAVLIAFYFVLINHLLGFALTRHVLSLLLDGERIWIAEVILYAGIFALLNYTLKPLYLAREFLYGLVFAYWYLRSGSLIYGAILGAILWMFLL